MSISIPKLSLVVLIGPSGSGKSTFGLKHFLPTEILSADKCRAMVSDDENNQAATKEAFEILHYIASKRLSAGKLTVIDATNVQPESRRPLINLAREFHFIPVAFVFDLPERICQDRNKNRPDRNFGSHVVRQQLSQLSRSFRNMKREGFRHIHQFRTVEEIDSVSIEREPLWNDLQNEHGPFDIIGDVHGCFEELSELLTKLGYSKTESSNTSDILSSSYFSHPDGRKAVFLGDLVDRGPQVIETIKLVYSMAKANSALCVPGNHDIKFMRKLRGWDVTISHGLGESLAQLEALDIGIKSSVSKAIHDFIDDLVSHYVLDDGKLVVAHAGLKAEMQGRGSGKVREFCLYGETTGETDEFGLAIRYNWAKEYRGKSKVVYGHTPIPEPEWLNNTINIDTGCVFGETLTALRYPEMEIVSVKAKRVYAQPARPILKSSVNNSLTAQQLEDELLEIEDVLGKRIIETRFRDTVTIREENATAALETISRFAVNPKWLIYLPPTMSPPETSKKELLLEHPEEALKYYRTQGLKKVICQKKHMGSRAIVVICADEKAATERFGVLNEGLGRIYTRTGRPFFVNSEIEIELLDRLRQALGKVNFWERFNSTWACFDCELMPWSSKAQDLLKNQYAAVGAAAKSVLNHSIQVVNPTNDNLYLNQTGFLNSPKQQALLANLCERANMVEKYVNAYRHYCWPVKGIEDYKLAPFHLMATEGKVHTDLEHVGHLGIIEEICSKDSGVLLSTDYVLVDFAVSESFDKAVSWWQENTDNGEEGMVIKPNAIVTKGKRGLLQPALKCRGREYLRIIYGAEYTKVENLKRLRVRAVASKRSLAMREFVLGIEGLERFVNREPLRRVHECVFGVLALESEPVDPRL